MAFAIFSASESFLTSTSNAAVHFSVFISTVFPILRQSEAAFISLDTFVSLRYSKVNPLNPASFFLSAAIRSSNCKQAYSQSVLASSNLASSAEYPPPIVKNLLELPVEHFNVLVNLFQIPVIAISEKVSFVSTYNAVYCLFVSPSCLFSVIQELLECMLVIGGTLHCLQAFDYLSATNVICE